MSKPFCNKGNELERAIFIFLKKAVHLRLRVKKKISINSYIRYFLKRGYSLTVEQ